MKGQELLKALSPPELPGIYKMIAASGQVLYIGKAKNIKKRIKQYINPNNSRIQIMVSKVAAVEFFITTTEIEALVVEAKLIKQLQPQYNILVKDDKSYPYILITDKVTKGPGRAHDFPRIIKYRGKRIKGCYGPFPSVFDVKQNIIALQKTFLIRPCSDPYFASRKRPCLEYQIKRCSAPCVGKISKEDYKESIIQAKNVLAGKINKISNEFKAKMQEASKALEYERASLYRDKLQALRNINSINFDDSEEAYYIAIYSQDSEVEEGAYAGEIIKTCIEIIFFDAQRGFGSFRYFFNSFEEKDIEISDSSPASTDQFERANEDEIEIGLKDKSASEKPSKAILETELESQIETEIENEGAQEDIYREPLAPAAIVAIEAAEKAAALDIEDSEALENNQDHTNININNNSEVKNIASTKIDARLSLFLRQFCLEHKAKIIYTNVQIGMQDKEAIAELASYNIKVSTPLKGIKYKMINLAYNNARLALKECLKKDINIQEKLYKFFTEFNLKKIPEKIEVYDNSHISGEFAVGVKIALNAAGFDKTEYRCYKIKDSNKADDYDMMQEVLARRFKNKEATKLPDFLLIDGGLGHFSVVKDYIPAGIEFVTIAKGKERNAGNETFFLNDGVSKKIQDRDLLHFLQVIRDEAHRFAIKAHRNLRGKSVTKSCLDDIPGIGLIRKKELLRAFGSVKGLKAASYNDLIKVKSITAAVAKNLIDFLKKGAVS